MSTDAVPVSIVIPILNEGATLPALLAALAAQSVKPAELIFVDAGSSDTGQRIIRDWAQNRGRGISRHVVLESPGAFPGAARNAGIAKSTQPWIAFLDAGITPDGDWLQTLMRSASSKRAAGVIGATRFTGRDALTTALCALSYGQGTTRPTLPGSMFQRDVFTRVGEFEPALRAGEDLLWLSQFRREYPDGTVESNAKATYSHFPESLPAAAKKWFEYEKHVARVRLSGPLPFFHAAVLMVAVGAIAAHTATALALFLFYLLARGIADPIRRSARWNWWREHPASFLFAPPCAVVIDAAKIAGSIKGLLERAYRPIR